MATYRTPGVYVEEISTFPPSVAAVSTAIPAFLGYTEKGSGIRRINTLLEYETEFGKAYPSTFDVTTRQNAATQLEELVAIQRVPPRSEFLLYDSLNLYFQNGGGSCYVVSVGNYDPSKPVPADLARGLDELEKEDEPTLILLTDAVNLNATDYYALCQQALTQCNKLGDRFAILDVLPDGKPDGGVAGFRKAQPSNSLKYGAAYYPYLQTSLNYRYEEQDVRLGNVTVALPQHALTWSQDFGDKGITVTYTGSSSAERPAVEITAGRAGAGASGGGDFRISRPPTIVLTIDASGSKTGAAVVTAWEAWITQPGNASTGFSITTKGDGSDTVTATRATPLGEPRLIWAQDFGDKGITVTYTGDKDDTPAVNLTLGKPEDSVTFSFDQAKKVLSIAGVAGKTGAAIMTAWTAWIGQAGHASTGFSIAQKGDGSGPVTHTLYSIQSTNTALYNQIKATLNQQRVVLPPSAAMAGIYAQVDRERGVWKAPANVSIAAVIGPVRKITHDEQEGLNIDPTAGKSINAIREFTGKGTLVWGARTLAGNDNEWRYVPVRRLFNMIEESARKATAFAVFEPNDATTWLKVKAMIESFLYGLWERGALAGSTPKAAYFVNVGLGKTMTPQNVLDGLMIVEIGVAAVRPAEFIILRFTHKMQEA
jgi:phage tail sheath protein FI